VRLANTNRGGHFVSAAIEHPYSDDWAADLEDTVNYTIDSLLADLEDPDALGTSIPVPSGSPFCGCETCVRREIMHMTMTATLDAVRAGLVD
jgi:hypothetical protein